jgi:LAO/AO transport system kinase
VDDILERFREGNRRALARIVTQVENATPSGREYLRELFPLTGTSHTVGITGSPGAGKSSLVSALTAELRRRDKTVGIVAVDPSSPFSHGAILGDRIRMQDVALDPGVYMRSMASRGSLGGLSPTLADVVDVFDAFGFDYILIETVGAGQTEVEVASTAITTILVNNPGTGDDIQAMKAGIVEIADVMVVNKADHPGADTLVSQLRSLLALSPPGSRRPEIVKTVSIKGEGFEKLADAIDEHLEYLKTSGNLAAHLEKNARKQVLDIARSLLEQRIQRALNAEDIDELMGRVASRRLNPHDAAAELVAASGATLA